MNNLLIDNDNSIYKNYCHHHIKFKATDNIDKYISTVIIPQLLLKHDFSTLYIKDTLSSNYLELHGIILAYHIRLSKELKEKRFVPIVILSDTTRDILNKIDPIARILFTKNIYLIPNTTEAIKKFQTKDFKPLEESEFNSHFLDLITVAPPENSTSHSIANEWAIERWAYLLGIENNKTIEKNRKKMSSMLYFKYLKQKYILDESEGIIEENKNLTGTLLFIDDKGLNGWNRIVKTYMTKSYPNITFELLRNKYKEFDSIKKSLEVYIEKNAPNIILLDLRLLKEDANKDEIEDITGIKILKAIKELNPSIQVIMFSASNDSSILDNIRDEGILGYVKKDAPDDKYKSFNDGFEKLGVLIERGIERKYLMDVYQIQKEMEEFDFLKLDDEKINEIKQVIKIVFKVLNSNMPDNYIFAIQSIYKCIETICTYYILEKKEDKDEPHGPKKYVACWRNDNSNSNIGNTSTWNKLSKIKERFDIKYEDNLFYNLKDIRNKSIHPAYILDNTNIKTKDIIKWFELVKNIVDKLKLDKDIIPEIINTSKQKKKKIQPEIKMVLLI